ncbi:hypothetical protein EIM50_19505, partial [Pseudoxanthomonas sp. SGD-10]
MNEALYNDEVQDFILKNIYADVSKIALQKSPFIHVSSKELAEQIQAKKAIQKKLPLWFSTSKIVYPPKLNLEQSSSEQTALYKSSLIEKDSSVVDLTGGFGIDDFYFAKRAMHVVHCELNSALSEIVRHNSNILGASNITFYDGNGLSYLETIKQTDVIYIDPSRRATSGRVFLLEDCEPNVVESLDKLLSKADRIIIKAAPLLDIDAALKQLKHVSEVHVVSLNNECKELLFVIDKKHAGQTLIKCAVLKLGTEIFEFPYQVEKAVEISYHPFAKYLYEPDAALLKAGLFKSIAVKFGISKIHQHSHLYTSENLLPQFPGRSLKINRIQHFKGFSLDNNIKKANVVTRNFNQKPDQLKKKFKIQDGGDIFLYFTT